MKLIKGLYRDNSLEEQPNNTWVGGKNLVYSSKYNELVNEPGFQKLVESGVAANKFAGTVIGLISTPLAIVVFQVLDTSISDIAKNSEIGIVQDGVYTRILRANLNFNTNFPVFGETYYNYLDELIVAFFDNYNTPKIINLNNLPFTVTSTAAKDIVQDDDLYNLELFSPFNVPVYILQDVIESGGSLLAGAYYITLQYQLPDGSYGNFMHISNPIIIHNSVGSQKWNLITGSKPGTPTSKTISLFINNIDTRYKKLRFGIIHKAESIKTCYISEAYNISNTNSTFNIGSTEGFEVVEITEFLAKSAYYNKVGAVTNIDNTLWIANLTTIQDIRYQKYANNIKIEPVFEDEVSLNGYRGSYKDPIVIFNNRTFMPGEIYAFYIRFHYKDGNKVTAAFHIPGRALTAGELTTVSGANSGADIHTRAKVYQFQDTCSSTKMSAWENENELYPNESTKEEEDQEYNGAVDYNGDVIANGVNLSGNKVRHHKFPTVNWLQKNTDLFGGNSISTMPYKLLTSPMTINLNGNPYTKSLGFAISSVPLEYMSINNTKFTNVSDSTAYVNVTLQVSGAFTGSSSGIPMVVSGYVRLIKNNGFIDTVLEEGLYPSSTFLNVYLSRITPVSLEPGESVRVEALVQTSGTGEGWEVSGNYSGSVKLESLLFRTVLDGTVSSKILGIRVKNITLTDEIKEKCSHYEILYAERTNDNTSVLGQVVLNNKEEDVDVVKGASYDLESTKKIVNPTHAIADLDYKTVGSIVDYSEDYFDDGPSAYNFKIDKFTYIPPNSNFTEGVINEYRSGYVGFIFDDSTFPAFTVTKVRTLATLISFKPDVYINFTNQKLVRTGQLQEINSNLEVIPASSTIYGGDAYVNMQPVARVKGFVVGERIADTINFTMFPVFSTINIGMRYKGEELNEIFYPVFNFAFNDDRVMANEYSADWFNNVSSGFRNGGDLEPIRTSLWDKIRMIYSYFQDENDTGLYLMPEWYPNLLDYNSINNIEPIIKFDINDNFTNRFPYRIHKSLTQTSESKNQSWRVFLPNEYHESAFNKGRIIQLSTDGKDLLILHQHSLFVARNIQQLNIEEGVVSALGNANIFGVRPIEITYDKSGYVGCQSKFAVVPCKFGVFIVDRRQGKIFLYRNLEVKEISANGMEKWFKTNLQYNRSSLNEFHYYWQDGELILWEDEEPMIYAPATIDEKLGIDNPYTQIGIHTSWDDENSRLLLSKVYNGDTETSINSFTLSYYPELEQWAFFHDYLPNISLNNRLGLFHLFNNSLYLANNFRTRTTYFNDPFPADIYNSLSVGDNYLGGVVAHKQDGIITLLAPTYATAEKGSWGNANSVMSGYSYQHSGDTIDGWRLPTANELSSIRYNIYLSHNTSPPLDVVLDAGFHWTSETFEDNARGSNLSTFTLEWVDKNNEGFARGVKTLDSVIYAKDFYIDVVFNMPIKVDKLFQSIEWLTKVYINNVEKKHLTFTHAVIFNQVRYSGNLTLVTNSESSNYNTRRTGNVWRFNEFRDILKNKNQEVFDILLADILENQIDADDIATNWYDHNLFNDAYIVVRLIANINAAGDELDFRIFEIGANSKLVIR